MQRTTWNRARLIAALLAALVTVPAAAQLLPTAAADAPAPVVEGVFGVLYDQTASQGVNGISSQDFTDAGGVNDAFDAMAADDFVVPAGSVWDIHEIDVPAFFGAAGPGPVDTVDVAFYADAGGLPGAAACTYDDLVPVSQAAGALSIALPAPCTLFAGVAWVSVQAAAPSVPNGQWFWFESTVQVGNPFAWRNPGDGFGTGCTAYTAAIACGAVDPDLAFVLRGNQRVDIPTLGAWGMLLFAAALALLAFALLRRRQARAH